MQKTIIHYLFPLSIVLALLIMAYYGCNSGNKGIGESKVFLEQENCPFPKIQWSNVGIKRNFEIKQNFNLELEAELRTYLQKIGVGDFKVKPTSSLEVVYQNFEEKNIGFDREYVTRYNALIDDICGTIGLLHDDAISSEKKKSFENMLENKVENLYQFIFKEGREEKKVEDSKNRFPNCYFDLSTPQYIVCVFATSDKAKAENIVKLFKEKGYKDAGKFWLPNCPSTGSTKLYQVYADKIPTLDQAYETMCIIANREEFQIDYKDPFVIEIVDGRNPVQVYYSNYDCDKKQRK